MEKLNRENFKALMNALSSPGAKEKIKPVFNSYTLAVASVLLYSEVSFFYEGGEDMELIATITNAKKDEISKADYIFCDSLDTTFLKNAKTGSPKEPEFSATLIVTCKDFKGMRVCLEGAGVDGQVEVNLPINEEFLKIFEEKNVSYPMGNEIFFVSQDGKVMALSRTTKTRGV